MRPVYALLVPIVLATACGPKPTRTVSPSPLQPAKAQSERPAAAPAISAQAVRSHIAFLAADAQEGRAPGTAADTRVQTYVEKAMMAAKLEPGLANGFRQSFEIVDGVRVYAGTETLLDVSGLIVPHRPVPFSADTKASGPVVARLVYVGFGIPKGQGGGDYRGLARKVKGSIVVARAGGPDDPRIGEAERRAQSKAIAARDHGAVGFILWDPSAEVPLPNHGEARDLGLPAVFVGKAGTQQLVRVLSRGRADDAEAVRPGARSSKMGTLQTPVERVQVATANIVGKLPGPGANAPILVVGAHMDHLGFGNASSLAPDRREIHNGADDNASGVAVMLELCAALARLDAKARPFEIRCLAFGAEEMGLLGSKHYVEGLAAAERERIAAMLNFDMVGRLGPDGLIVDGVGTSKAWAELIAATKADLVVRTGEGGYGPSDHSSFYGAEVPVLHMFTGAHEDYHKPSDDLAKINVDGAVAVALFSERLVKEVLARKLVPDYVAQTRPSPRRGGFRASLGTVPDYAARVDGVRLEGVRAGGAAEKAGLRKGDVIQRLGERDVHNVDDYMAAFAEMKPDVAITVVVERDGNRVELQLTPQAPPSR